jgi:hypothetical protein
MIITLCGSARFEREFHHWNEILTFDGHTVFSLSVLPSFKGDKNWYTPDQKIALDEAHKRKIASSDAIFVIDRPLTGGGEEPYVGDSTRSEIAYAVTLGKKIFGPTAIPPVV